MEVIGVRKYVAWFVVLMAMIMSGCSESSKDTLEKANVDSSLEQQMQLSAMEIKEPVELAVSFGAVNGHEWFMDNFGKFIQQKYPNISFKFYNNDVGNRIPDLVAANIPIDLILGSGLTLTTLKDLHLATDITDLVKKYNVDLSGIEPTTLNVLKIMDNGKLAGLPYVMSTLQFFYNKSIFDRFGVPYLTDKQTWDEIAEISRRLTRTDGGNQYYGFGTNSTHFANLNQLSLKLVEADTLKSALNNDGWANFLRIMSPLFKVPGEAPGKTSQIYGSSATTLFQKDQRLAMLVATQYPSKSFYGYPEGWDLNWDVAQFPVFAEKPGIGPQPYPNFGFVTSTSKHRDASFIALTQLVSKEVQTAAARDLGRVTILKDQSVRDAFGATNTELSGKNRKAMFPSTYAEPVLQNENSQNARYSIMDALIETSTGAKDINTALRDAEEAVNKKADELKKK